MDEKRADLGMANKIRAIILSPIKFIQKQSSFMICIYIILLVVIMSLIGLIPKIDISGSKAIVTITTENFLDAIREGDLELIMLYSDAKSEDFEDVFNEILLIGKENINNVVNSWFGSDGTKILNDIIGISNKIGGNIFYQMMDYKIASYKKNKEKAIVKIQLTRLNTNINIALYEIDKIWIVDYKNYKREFDNAVLGSTATKILTLLNLGRIF
jgi:uncharacterized membrane protein (DUF441 family)